MKIIDIIATKIADKVNAVNDEAMSLTQENELLKQKLAASDLTVSDYQERICVLDLDNTRLHRDIVEHKKHDERIYERIKSLTEENCFKESVIKSYAEKITELESDLAKNTDEKMLKLKNTNKNQIKYIEIIQNIASAKSDKTVLKDVFSHNLDDYLTNNYVSLKQASEKLDINRTTLREIRTGKTALSYDNFDILDSKMCEYFGCKVCDLVTVKMEGKK